MQHSSFVFLNSFHYQFCLFVLIRGTVMVDIVRVNADTRHQRTRTVPLKEKERTRTTFMKHGKLSGSNYWSIFKFHIKCFNRLAHWQSRSLDCLFWITKVDKLHIYSVLGSERRGDWAASASKYGFHYTLRNPMCFISFSLHKLAPAS